jgi:hypothetical protein
VDRVDLVDGVESLRRDAEAAKTSAGATGLLHPLSSLCPRSKAVSHWERASCEKIMRINAQSRIF